MLVHLCGPEAGINSEIVTAANDKDQAGMVFKYVRQIIQLSPRLEDILTVVPSTMRVVYHGRGNVFAAISSRAGTKHGLNPSVVIYDELAQATSTDLFDALDTSMGAQDEPIFFTISTQSHDPQHPLSQMIDDALIHEDPTIVCHLYEVEEEVEDIFDPETWIGANPALGDFRSLEDLVAYARRAKRLPSLETTMRNLYLNQRVSRDVPLLTRAVWNACADPDLEFVTGERIYLGLDFARTTDLASLAMMSEDGARCRAFFWKPEDLMKDHGHRDRKDYLSWLDLGFMQPCPGKTIQKDHVGSKIAELHSEFEIVGLAYDRWRLSNIEKVLDGQGIEASDDEHADLRLFKWGQGFNDMSPALDALEALAIDEAMTHDANPVLSWNIANAIVSEDPAGNRKFDKKKSRMRIDGAVALAMAAGLRDRFQEEDINSIYQTMKPVVV